MKISKPKPSSFFKWFEWQEGPRPRLPGKSDESLLDAVRDGKRAEGVLAKQELYDARMEAALYAWQAREKQL
jgi:hypothetical protein